MLVECKALKEPIQPKLKCKKLSHNSTQGNHRILNNLKVGRLSKNDTNPEAVSEKNWWMWPY